MRLKDAIFKLGRGISKFTGAILGAALVPAYSIISIPLSFVYFAAVTPFAIAAHFRAKYLNRRMAGQSIISAALSTLIISPIGFALKFALIATPIIIAMPFSFLGIIGSVFAGIARGLKYGLFAVLNPFFKKDLIAALRKKSPFINSQYNQLDILKASKTTLEANPDRTALQERELNVIKSKIKKLDAVLNPSLFQSIANPIKALFIALAPNRFATAEDSHFLMWLMTTGPRITEALGMNNEALQTIFANINNNQNQTAKPALIANMKALTPSSRHIAYLSPEEEVLLTAETDDNIVKLYNNYKKIIEENICPISLNTLSEMTNPITIKKTHYSENSENNKSTYVTYELDDFIHYLNQPNAILQTTDRTSLVLSEMSKNSETISGMNADGHIIEIFKGCSPEISNELEQLSIQLKQHLNKSKFSSSSTRDMQATFGTNPVSNTSTTVVEPSVSFSSGKPVYNHEFKNDDIHENNQDEFTNAQEPRRNGFSSIR